MTLQAPSVDIINDGYAICDNQELTLLYCNSTFRDWFHVDTMRVHLADIMPEVVPAKVLKRIARRGAFVFNFENNNAPSDHPILVNLSFKETKIDNVPYITVHARDYSILKEKDAIIQGHLKVIEKNNRDLHRKNEQLNSKNEQLHALSSKLGKYLSPQLYSSIFTEENQVNVETNRKELTIFYSNVQGFTELSDILEPATVSDMLNTYLQEMSEIANRYGGTIDKFIGEGILIFFGDPESKGIANDAADCVKMALEMLNRMNYLRKEWKKLGLKRLFPMRIGINSGICTVGHFGSENRMEYTVVGQQVYLASRLEVLADFDEILISESTFDLLDDNEIQCIAKGMTEVKGWSDPVQMYQVIGLQNEEKQNTLLEKSLPGFSLSLDFEQANKAQVVNMLEQLLGQIQSETSPSSGT